MQNITRIAALLLVALAVILAIVAFAISRRADPAPTQVTADSGTQVPAAPTFPVVAAATTLRAGIPIQPHELEIVEASERPIGSYPGIQAAAGKVPARDVHAGTLLTEALIAHGLALQLAPGERALAVPIDELAGAGNRIMPGDHVDVFLHLPADRQDTPGQTRLLLSRLRVLSYGDADHPEQVAERQPAEGDASGAESGEEPRGTRTAVSARRSSGGAAPGSTTARSAVLAVPVEHANRLLLGAQTGKLFLGLRHPGDTRLADAALFPEPRRVLPARAGLDPVSREALALPENEAFAGIDSAALSGRASTVARPATAPQRQGPPPLEIIRGDGRGSSPSSF